MYWIWQGIIKVESWEMRVERYSQTPKHQTLYPSSCTTMFAPIFQRYPLQQGAKKKLHQSSLSSLLFSGAILKLPPVCFQLCSTGGYRCNLTSERVKLMPFFRKRVQNYCFFFNWPNILATFFQKKCILFVKRWFSIWVILRVFWDCLRGVRWVVGVVGEGG